jgi:hypothetical protein
MTEKKKLKKRVRARMGKTGENYTQALSSTQNASNEDRQPDPALIRRVLNSKTPTELTREAQILYRALFGSLRGEHLFLTNVLNTLMPANLPYPENPREELRSLIQNQKELFERTTKDQRIVRKFARPSGWLGDIPKDVHMKIYEDSEEEESRELQDEIIFEGAPIEPSVESLLALCPDVSKVFGVAPVQPTMDPEGPEIEKIEKIQKSDPKDITINILTKEVDRLRRKLEEAGIHPDL